MKLALEKDLIEVELEPEKKGLLLKHREYTVSSKVGVIAWLSGYRKTCSEFAFHTQNDFYVYNLNVINKYELYQGYICFTKC